MIIAKYSWERGAIAHIWERESILIFVSYILVIYGIIKTVDIFFQNSVEMLITYRFDFIQISIFKVFITLSASQGFGRVKGDKLWSCHVKCKFNFYMCLKRYKYIYNFIYIFHRVMQMLILVVWLLPTWRWPLELSVLYLHLLKMKRDLSGITLSKALS